jgi:hypothetical protein
MTASGVKLTSGDVMQAHIAYDGTTLTLVLTDTVTSRSFTKSLPIDIPSIVGSGTAYVGFTAATGGLTMTSNILNWTLSAGSTTTFQPALLKTAKTVAVDAYSIAAEIPSTLPASTAEISKSEGAPMLASSLAPVATEQRAGEPRLFPQPGVFTGDLEVTLRCDTPDAVIHYTFDGSQPVASSPVYGAPISVKGTELTIKAFASVPGQRDSAVVTGIYRIRE